MHLKNKKRKYACLFSRQRFVGIDEVNFKVSDGLYNNTGKIIFDVYNNPPTADNLTAVVNQGESKVIYPTLKDIDGDSVQIKLGKIKPKKGKIVVRNNRMVYTPYIKCIWFR